MLDTIYNWRQPERQKQFSPSHAPNFASNARDDYFIRSTLLKQKLRFDPIGVKVTHWSSQSGRNFFKQPSMQRTCMTVYRPITWKPWSREKYKEAIASLDYTAETCNVAWNVLACSFGKLQKFLNAQMKQIHSVLLMKAYDSRVDQACENSVELHECSFTSQLRVSPKLRGNSGQWNKEVNTGQEKEVAFVDQGNLCQPGVGVFSDLLNDIADVQDEMLLSSNPNAVRTMSSYKETAKPSSFATRATNPAKDNSKTQPDCVLKDGKHLV